MDLFLWVYRQLYWCKRRLCPGKKSQIVRVHSDSLPWFWIGMKYEGDDAITVTEIINHEIQYGAHVTPQYLTEVTGFKGGVWRYMDVKTLEERDFPSEGFIIEDVLDKSISDSE